MPNHYLFTVLSVLGLLVLYLLATKASKAKSYKLSFFLYLLMAFTAIALFIRERVNQK